MATQYRCKNQARARLIAGLPLPPVVNGIDYPLPAINIVIRTRSLQRAGFVSNKERLALNEIYKANPLLFDFVLKRTLHAPGSDRKLRKEIFTALPGAGF